LASAAAADDGCVLLDFVDTASHFYKKSSGFSCPEILGCIRKLEQGTTGCS